MAVITLIALTCAIISSCGMSRNSKRGCDGKRKTRVEMGYM